MTDSQQQDKNVFEQEARTFRVDLNQLLIESSKKGIHMPAILAVLIEGVKISEAILKGIQKVDDEGIKRIYHYAEQIAEPHIKGLKE